MGKLAQDNKFVRSLLQNAQRGNYTSLEQLFKMNIGKVYAIVLRMTASKSFASKITIDTFIEAWKKLNIIREDSPFTGWLIAIAVYKTLDVFRNNKDEFTQKPDLTEIESKDSFENDILRLPHLERLIFVLNKIERYSIDEISDMILMKKDDVEFHLNLAIEKLHDKYPLYKFDNSFQERISKLPIEIQPDKSVSDEIFNYIYNERMKISEREETEKPKEKDNVEEEPKKEKKKKESKEPKQPKQQVQLPEISVNLNAEHIKKYLVVALSILAIGVVVYFWLNRAKGWNVNVISGKALINNVSTTKEAKLDTKSTLITDESSSVELLIPAVGILQVEPNSSISRTAKDLELRINKGKIVKKSESQEAKLSIITDLADINEDLSSDYEFTVEDELNTLFVYRGIVKVGVKGIESVVPEGYVCQIKKGRYAVPYNPNSDSEIINLIKEFRGPADANLPVISHLATKKDALSLWHILQLTTDLNRPIAYNKLKELIKPPDSVTETGIQKLDQQMLDQWLVKILAEK